MGSQNPPRIGTDELPTGRVDNVSGRFSRRPSCRRALERPCDALGVQDAPVAAYVRRPFGLGLQRGFLPRRVVSGIRQRGSEYLPLRDQEQETSAPFQGARTGDLGAPIFP